MTNGSHWCAFYFNKLLVSKVTTEDFPDGPMVKNSPANAGDIGSVPGPGRFHMPQSN